MAGVSPRGGSLGTRTFTPSVVCTGWGWRGWAAQGTAGSTSHSSHFQQPRDSSSPERPAPGEPLAQPESAGTDPALPARARLRARQLKLIQRAKSCCYPLNCSLAWEGSGNCR